MEQLFGKVGGPFRLTVLVQKRIKELKKGSPKLVNLDSNNLMEIVYQEILEDRISLEIPPDLLAESASGHEEMGKRETPLPYSILESAPVAYPKNEDDSRPEEDESEEDEESGEYEADPEEEEPEEEEDDDDYDDRDSDEEYDENVHDDYEDGEIDDTDMDFDSED